ncbi:efflux RND transporter permease subunit [Leptospira brenneri]|uniref:efflux RND transporter permease subunit n=1 Tax=Leptospira brenneri TaxID=2023182 RepID=UPI000C2A3B50|nr:efflux RND transporter permease subunit [Leptospira brenneri]PJZ44774.1 heavy metal RND transporter permease [Leptospira brenneri]
MNIDNYVRSLSKHRRLYFVISFSLLIAVFFRLDELQIWLLPRLTPIRYFVVTEFPNHSAEDTDLMVSLPISEILSSVKSVERIRSVSEHGKSIVQLDLSYRASLSEFEEELYQTIFEMKDKLPPGVGVSRLVEGGSDDKPFMEILISKPNEKDLENFDFHLKQLQFQLERISGITKVQILGKPKESTFISIDPKVIDLFPLNIRNLELQILSGLHSGSLGKVEGFTRDTELKFASEIKSKDDLNTFQIHLENGKSTSLAQLTKIFDSELPEERLTRVGGKETIYIAIYSDTKTNPLRVSEAVQNKINGFEMFSAKIYSDVSQELRTSLIQFVMNLIWGLGFAFLFSYFLYRSLVPSLLLFVSVFFSLILFFHLILFFSVSINLLSLGGISVGIGMLFDASNLTVFSIRSQLLSQKNPIEAVSKGIRSVIVSLFSSSLTTIVVFIPLLVFPMEWKDFLFDSGVSIALLVFCSFVSSLWIVPLFSVSFPEIRENKEKIERKNLILNWYSRTYQLGEFFLQRNFIIGFVLVLGLSAFCFGSRFEIFPKQSSVGLKVKVFPKKGMSLQEELYFVHQLETQIQNFDPGVSVLVYPIEISDDSNKHPEKAVPIQWKFFGTQNPKNLEDFLNKKLSDSHWDWRLESIESEVSKALPFLPYDSIVFLDGNLEKLLNFSYEWRKNTEKLKLVGDFDFLPNPIIVEEWSRFSIPVPEFLPDEDDLKNRILYQNIPRYLGELGNIHKRDLYLGIGLLNSNFLGEENSERTNFKTKLNDLVSAKSIYTPKNKTSYDEFRRESGLFYLEWMGVLSDFDKDFLKRFGISFIKFSAEEEIYKFFSILIFLFFIAFVFIYLALVGIYESFQIPIFYLGISIFYLFVASLTVWILFDTFHLGHYIGLVVLLGLSIDNISLFGERWKDVPLEAINTNGREIVFRWLAEPIFLNAGTTMMGFLPVLFFGFSGSEFSRSIALTMFVGIPISVFFVFYIYPYLFQRF